MAKTYGEVHDNVINSYCIDFENGTILFNTVFFGNGGFQEPVSILFKNVMGYSLSDAIWGSCDLFNIEEYTVEEYINSNEDSKSILVDIGNCFPLKYKFNNHKELMEQIMQNNQKLYFINPSTGLGGWILAEKIILTGNISKIEDYWDKFYSKRK